MNTVLKTDHSFLNLSSVHYIDHTVIVVVCNYKLFSSKVSFACGLLLDFGYIDNVNDSVTVYIALYEIRLFKKHSLLCLIS